MRQSQGLPCCVFDAGSNGRCVYCDHGTGCHLNYRCQKCDREVPTGRECPTCGGAWTWFDFVLLAGTVAACVAVAKRLINR